MWYDILEYRYLPAVSIIDTYENSPNYKVQLISWHMRSGVCLFPEIEVEKVIQADSKVKYITVNYSTGKYSRKYLCKDSSLIIVNSTSDLSISIDWTHIGAIDRGRLEHSNDDCRTYWNISEIKERSLRGSCWLYGMDLNAKPSLIVN